MTTAAKIERAERELSATHRKVLEAVPMREGWTAAQICGELIRLGVNLGHPKVEWSLRTLVETGLVRDRAGLYMRVHSEPTTDEGAPEVPAPAPAVVSLVPVAPAQKRDTLARIADLSARLRGQAAVLQDLADEIDDVAIEVEERIAEVGEGAKKLQQLRALLGSI